VAKDDRRLRRSKEKLRRNPDQMKLPYYLSTREAVVEWIEQKFGIWLSVWTGGRYLARSEYFSHIFVETAPSQNWRCWFLSGLPGRVDDGLRRMAWP
jgi:hypothetical protein